MTSPLAAPEVLNREFLEIRAKILEIPASLDRLDRAEQAQMVFSLPYDDGWREKFSLAPRR